MVTKVGKVRHLGTRMTSSKYILQFCAYCLNPVPAFYQSYYLDTRALSRFRSLAPPPRSLFIRTIFLPPGCFSVLSLLFFSFLFLPVCL